MMRRRSGRGTSDKKMQSYIRRAESISPHEAPAHLDSIVISLHQAIDAWRYHGAPYSQVDLCLDALWAMTDVICRREEGE